MNASTALALRPVAAVRSALTRAPSLPWLERLTAVLSAPAQDCTTLAKAGKIPLNLALQGGGAHGAFTWGVLDRLLEDERITFGSVSGTSAGAMNAAVLASGLLHGGREGAREMLAHFWEAVAKTARYSPMGPHPLDRSTIGRGEDGAVNAMMFDLMTRVLSPYQFNPLDFDPLGDVLARGIDFKSLSRRSPVDLYIAATEVASGRARIFETREITLDVVLASACLPQLRKAVKIGRHHYWDGGFSANPPLLPLLCDGRADDTLIVQLNPSREPQLPTDARNIIAQMNRITFNAPLRRELETIAHLKTVANEGLAIGGAARRRVRRHRLHHIEAANLTRDLGPSSKLNPDRAMLCDLRDRGRGAAQNWLRRHGDALGERSTFDPSLAGLGAGRG